MVLPKTKANQSTEFGQRLKQLREARSLNVAEFAKRIQASPAAIWHWEHRGTLPRIGALNAIAEVLSLSPKTVRTYRARILDKLEIRSTAELIFYVLHNDLLTDDPPDRLSARRRTRGRRPAL